MPPEYASSGNTTSKKIGSWLAISVRAETVSQAERQIRVRLGAEAETPPIKDRLNPHDRLSLVSGPHHRCQLLSPGRLPAQEPASKPETTPVSTAPTLSVDARLVNLPVVVRDKKGALIQNLTKDDFVLQVDGKPQTIRYFDKDTNLPLTLGLLVDTSLSQRDVIDEERTASSTFLDQMMTSPKDKAFIMQFAGQTELLQDLTSSRPLLQAALKEIDTPVRLPTPQTTIPAATVARRRNRRSTTPSSSPQTSS